MVWHCATYVHKTYKCDNCNYQYDHKNIYIDDMLDRGDAVIINMVAMTGVTNNDGNVNNNFKGFNSDNNQANTKKNNNNKIIPIIFSRTLDRKHNTQ